MRDDDEVLAALAAADPYPGGADPVGGERHAEETRDAITATPAPAVARHRPPRPTVGIVLAAVSVAVVALVVAAFIHAGSSSRRPATIAPARPVNRVVLRVEPSQSSARVTPAGIRRALALLRTRIRDLGVAGVTVDRRGARDLVVTIPTSEPVATVTRYLVGRPQLVFTDWEANVVAPDGRTVAAQDRRPDDAARLLGQGTVRGPGAASAGGLPLERAVALAAGQPSRSPASGPGREWFAFARSGPGGCRATRRSCYEAGPAASRRALGPTAGARVLVVAQGTTVVQALSAAGDGADYADPGARFFVLHEDDAVTEADVTGARVVSVHGAPSVDVALSGAGAERMQMLTATLARRGATLGGTDLQHFAVILDGALLSVPTIDYRVYPEGLIRPHAIEITGGLTRADAESIAARIEPLVLRVVGHR